MAKTRLFMFQVKEKIKKWRQKFFGKGEMPQRPIKPETKWWSFSMAEIFKILETDENGLAEEEVKNRLSYYGPNELPHKKEGGWLESIKNQFFSPLILVLLGACLISLILGDLIDAGVIFIGLAINLMVGVWQELKASQALKKLHQAVLLNAKVIREGEEKLVRNINLVPGDIVILEPGDRVPADLRIFKAYELKIDESLLTGESEACAKSIKILSDKTLLMERENMAFLGTVVTEGQARGVVVETGLTSTLGRVAESMIEIKEVATPLQTKLKNLALKLTRIVLLLCGLIFLIGLLYRHSFLEMLTTSVAVAVSAIPEGLVVIVTVILALGMQRILKQGAVVKQLLSAEILGSTQVMCVDKTGTLTEGKMQVVKIATLANDFGLKTETIEPLKFSAQEEIFLLEAGLLCNNAYTVSSDGTMKTPQLIGNLTEQALILAGMSLGISKESLARKYPRLDEIPFSPRHKFMMTLNRFNDSQNVIYLKGAPEKVLLFSDHLYSSDVDKGIKMSTPEREKIVGVYEKMSKEGWRVLAVAYKLLPKEVVNISGDFNRTPAEYLTELAEKIRLPMPEVYTNFVLIGLVAIKDPVRENVKETLALTKEAGIKTVMITGDNRFTARAVAKEIGWQVEEKNILEGDELDRISTTDLQEKVKQIKIYARTTPEQKLKIVRAWQEKGAVVAMTGDGINDAPALKQADLGVALGTATDVAREASDLILLDNDFSVLVEAVKQGRIIFANIKKVVLYLLSDALNEMTIIILALFFRWPLPILASQIIWINMLDDVLPAIALAYDPDENNVMKEKPVLKKAEIIDQRNKILIGVISLVSAIFILISFLIFWQQRPENLVLARTMAFTTLAVDSLFYALALRQVSQPIWRTKFWRNWFLMASLGAGILLQVAAIYNSFLQSVFKTTPLNGWHWLYIILVNILLLMVIEGVKFFWNRKEIK